MDLKYSNFEEIVENNDVMGDAETKKWDMSVLGPSPDENMSKGNDVVDFLEDAEWISTANLNIEDGDDQKTVSKKQFLGKMFLLSKRQKWIENRSRR
jgi:hypothetical protein